MKWPTLIAKTETLCVYDEKKFGRIDSRSQMTEIRKKKNNIFFICKKDIRINEAEKVISCK